MRVRFWVGVGVGVRVRGWGWGWGSGSGSISLEVYTGRAFGVPCTASTALPSSSESHLRGSERWVVSRRGGAVGK